VRTVANKWSKWSVLEKHAGVAKHLPESCLFQEQQLKSMLDRHPFVVAKPLVGSGGSGVVKIEKVDGKYRYQVQGKTAVANTWDELMSALGRIRKGRRYLLQQGIAVAPVHGRRVDYRVKLVKKDRRWVVTAVVAKLARSGFFVTNLCRGGTLWSASRALRHTFPKLAADKKKTMIGVARTCTALLEKRYPGIGELGYDFGIDRQGSVWLFEVNTRPQ